MKSSNMEKIFNYTPEDTKSLSPLTYYQPFQSSFDPEFAMQSTKDPREETHCGWRRGVERQRQNFLVSRGTILNQSNHNRPSSSPQTPKTNAMASTSAWRSEYRNHPSELCGYGPSHSFSNHGTNANCLELYEQVPPRGGGRGAYPRTLDTSYHTGVVQCAPEARGYSLFGSCGKNPLKTGQSRPMICNFCKNNKEVPDIYLNHYLYDPDTKVLTCPVLRKHVCEVCGGTGDSAHTLQYCPVNRGRGFQAKVPVLLKTRTITNSTGKIRRN